MPRTDIRKQIERAFQATSHPGNANKDISGTGDDEGVADYFRGRTWQGHQVIDLRYHSAALSFFTDKAFRYWLPAFMLAEIEDPIEADVIADSIAFHIGESQYAEKRLAQFTPEELDATAAFLNDCANYYSIDGIPDVDFRKAEDAVRAKLQKR